MKHWKKRLIALIAFVGLMLAIGWWVRREGAVDNIDSIEIACYYEGIDNSLRDLGEIRLGVRDVSDCTLPLEFFIFDHRQKIRSEGFDAVWRNDRYILEDLERGEELDPFRLRQETKLRSTKMIDKDSNVRKRFPGLISPAYLHSPLMQKLYCYQLHGFHLVCRKSAFFGDKFLYVADVRKKDLVIGFEQFLLKEEAVAYNASTLVGDPMRMELSESHLRGLGYIMKKKGDGYVPVSLETGAVAAFPPKELYVRDVLRRINEGAEEDYLARRRFSTDFHSELDSGVLGKEVLDLYGVEIRWNDTNRRYDIVE
jgi:hypothetical protein